MNFPAKALWASVASVCLIVFCSSGTAGEIPTVIDRAFAPGLAALKKSTGIVEAKLEQSQTNWKPNLQLLVGVKAVESSKQTVLFIELTTLRPPTTNNAGKPWTPTFQTNGFTWRNTNDPASTVKTIQHVWSLYPVRVRIFDGAGRKIKEGQTTLPWGLLTNGLVDLCRLSLNRQVTTNNSATGKSVAAKEFDSVEPDEEWVRSFGGGFLWLSTMLGQLQTVPTLKDVWEVAQCSFRLPSLWTMASSVFGSVSVTLLPRFEEISLIGLGPAEKGAAQYRFPIDLDSGKRNLSRAELLIGPAHGAEMMLGGIRFIHATHPTKPQQQVTAQVLAAGMAREELAEGKRSTK